MKKLFLLFFALGVLILFQQACSSDENKAVTTNSSDGPPPPPAPAPPPTTLKLDLKKGAYENKCATCHGEDGTAGIMGAADLSKSTLSHAAACAIVKNGKNAMKSFAGELDESQIDSIVKYVESLRK